MGSLLDFLVENPINDITEEIVVSQRLSKFRFTIKGMTGPEFTEYQTAATAIGRHKKVQFNSKLFNELVVINHTVEPNFRDAEAIKKAKCTTPEQFLYKSLLAGEIQELADRISSLSGFDKDLDETIDEAKNS